MTELLGEVRVKYDQQTTVDAALHAVKAALDGLKPAKEQEVRYVRMDECIEIVPCVVTSHRTVPSLPPTHRPTDPAARTSPVSFSDNGPGGTCAVRFTFYTGQEKDSK